MDERWMEEQISLVTRFSSCCNRVHNFILEVYLVNKVYHICNGLQNITLSLFHCSLHTPGLIIHPGYAWLSQLQATPSKLPSVTLPASSSFTTPPVGYFPFCYDFRPKLSLAFPGLPPSQHITIILIPSSMPRILVGYRAFIPYDQVSIFCLLLKVWFKCHLTDLTVSPLNVFWWCGIHAHKHSRKHIIVIDLSPSKEARVVTQVATCPPMDKPSPGSLPVHFIC